jgi:DUF1680 family protein
MERLNTISLNQIQINDPFWNRYTRLVTEKIIPYQWRVLNDQEPDAEPSGCIQNFRRAAGEEKGSFYGFVFQDTDFTLLPYHCWNNRTPGEMTVWMNHLL